MVFQCLTLPEKEEGTGEALSNRAFYIRESINLDTAQFHLSSLRLYLKPAIQHDLLWMIARSIFLGLGSMARWIQDPVLSGLFTHSQRPFWGCAVNQSTYCMELTASMIQLLRCQPFLWAFAQPLSHIPALFALPSKQRPSKVTYQDRNLELN